MPDRLHPLPKHREALEALLCEQAPARCRAYGSRVEERCHDSNDLWLRIVGIMGRSALLGYHHRDSDEQTQ